MNNTRTVEDTLHDVQELIIHHRNTISDELLKEIEEQLLERAIIRRRAKEFTEWCEQANNDILDSIRKAIVDG